MQQIDCKLTQLKITSIEASLETSKKGQINLNVNEKTSSRKPVDPEYFGGLLEFIITFSSKDCEEVHLQIKAEAYFTFNSKPDDFEEVIRQQCLPIAKESLYKKIKNITAEMGYSPIDLSQEGRSRAAK